MALSDRYDNILSTDSEPAADAYGRGLDLFLEGRHGALAAFEEAVAADGAFALGEAALARAAMMDGDMPRAKQAISRAKALSTGATARERSQIEILDVLLSGQSAEARERVQIHVRAYPRDAMCAQLCTNVFGLIGFSGEVGREAELLAFTSALLPHYGEDWWMMSMHALSLCETGQIAASLSLMERSLALNPRNAQAAHFKAHAQYEAGETEAGRAYLGGWIESYDRRSILHGHLSWHLALWALEQGDETGLWEAVDTAIQPGHSDSLPINVLTDTAAILFRAELAGQKVAPARWKALSAYASQWFPNSGQSFADLHAALAHAMAGEGAALARLAEGAQGFAGDLVRPAARAWKAMSQGAWAEALEALTPVMSATERVGGSRAQRDLLELSYAQCLLRTGERASAQRWLATRRPVLAAAPPLAGFGA
ncbi:MAG: tetratricopeptide repeat protein [Pseudomonadota bacterium]